MKKLAMISLMAVAFGSGQAFAEEDLGLEPCVNGEVSASGLYVTQAEENRALAALTEPCIHGEGGESGSYAVKTGENMARDRRLANVVELCRKKAVSAR